MARKTVTTEYWTDDIDGSDANETLRFSFEGENYVIDVNEEHAEAIRTSLAKWIKYANIDETAKVKIAEPKPVATKSKAASSRPRKAYKPKHTREEIDAVRSWAAANGIQVQPKVKIANSVWDAYNEAQSGASEEAIISMVTAEELVAA